MEKQLHSPPQAHFFGMTLSFLTANSKRELAWLLPYSLPKKRWWMGKRSSHICKVLFIPHQQSDTTSCSKEKGYGVAELGTGRQVTRSGTGQTLGTVSDVLLWVLSKYPFPGNLPRGTE